MNPQKTIIMADSGCDVNKVYRDQYGIRLLPFHVYYPEKDYLDSVDIDPMMIYKRFPDEFPSTSTPSMAEISDALDQAVAEGYENAIIVCISHCFSGTYNAVRLIGTQRDDIHVYAFDTLNISVSSGLYAIWAARKLEEGWSAEKIAEELPKKLPEGNIFFYMDTLKYLQRGGRIGRLSGMVGSILKIKPVISCDSEGAYYTVGMIRGERQSKKKLMESVVKFTGDAKATICVEEGGGNHLEALEFESMLRTNLPQCEFIREQQITASLAINTGPGLIGVGVLKNP